MQGDNRMTVRLDVTVIVNVDRWVSAYGTETGQIDGDVEAWLDALIDCSAAAQNGEVNDWSVDL